MKQHIKILFLIYLFFLSILLNADVGIFQMHSDKLYYSELSVKKSHLKQLHSSRYIDNLNIGEPTRFVFGNFYLFNPTVYSSFNSSTPTGINDGALWQGKGISGQFETGIVYTSKYLDIKIIPKAWFSQNDSFSLLPSAYSIEDSNRGKYGSIIRGMDLYQRPGDKFFYDFDFGKTALLLKYGILELEFSTDNFKLGPSRISPLIMSDNSAGFPHLRLGINSWETYWGVFEYNAFGGYLEESDFFDNDSHNNKTLITALSFGYSPAILPGFTIGFNRTLIAPMEEISPSVAFKIFDPFIFGGIIGEPYGYDKTDQRVSFVFDWSLPEVGFRVYTELGKNDYSTDYELLMRTPEHAGGITLGISKALGNYLLEFEYTELIESRDYDITDLGGGGTFYSHGIVTGGYTNKGQLLGAGIGSGSDAQTLTLSYFGEKHQIKGFFQRVGLIKDYIYGEHYKNKLPVDPDNPYGVDRLQFDLKLGIEALFELDQFVLFTALSTDVRFNYNFTPDKYLFNFFAAIGLQYKI